MIIKIIISKLLTNKLMQELQPQNQIFTLQRNIDEVIKDFTTSFNSKKTQTRYETVFIVQVSELTNLQQTYTIPSYKLKNQMENY